MTSVVMENFLAKSTITSFVWDSSVRVQKRFNTFAHDVFDLKKETDPFFPNGCPPCLAFMEKMGIFHLQRP
jgi:hypothetical protein